METLDKILAEYERSPESTTASESSLIPLPWRERQINQEPQIHRTVAGIKNEILLDALANVTEARTPWPLFVHGAAGTGKTCAGLATLDHTRGVYHTATKLCSLIIDAQNGRLEWYHMARGGKVSPEMFWSRLGDEPLAVLDEIGCRERVTDHQYECVKRFIDVRQGRPAIYLSNLSLEQLEKVYDDRIASRLASGTVVELRGEDRRIKK